MSDTEYLRKSRVHPLSVLIALGIYRAGRGLRGSLVWSPDSNIIDALDGAFYRCFDHVEPTGKRYLLGLDVSGSMGMSNIANSYLTCRDAAAAMAMVTVKSERFTHAVGFMGDRFGIGSTTLTELAFSKQQRLDDVTRMMSGLPFGRTDCALPMLYAMKRGIEVDVFVVYTDSETWCGGIHPSQALRQYREKTGINAKLIVCGMVSNGFSIADPDDAGMLDVVGFSTDVPAVMTEFAR